MSDRRLMRKTTIASAAGLALGLVAAMVGGGPALAAPARDLPGSVPSWATAAVLRNAAPDGDHVGFRVYLGWRDQAAASALATAVSTPGSASYRQFLTPQQFR